MLSIITDQLVQQLSLPVQKLTRQIVLTVFGGSQLSVSENTNCSVRIDLVQLNIDLSIVPVCIPRIDLVIGQDFTEDIGIKYQRLGNELEFSHDLHVNAVCVTESRQVNLRTAESCQQLESLINIYLLALLCTN